MTRRIVATVLAVVALAAPIRALTETETEPTPRHAGTVATLSPRDACPSEDACTVTYSHGAWHIRPIVP